MASTADALVPLESASGPPGGELSLLDRLLAGRLDHPADFLVRLDILRLLSIREAGGLGSFLGGRVRLFPHQLYVAERATMASPVRWLLADEVGLGKTVEACLILNRLVHAGQVHRCLVIAPDALTVQWLGELWRKYHQVFTLLDAARLTDVEKDFGPGFNPFDVHRRSVIAMELLIERPHLAQQAAAAGIDLLVVDEAQHVRRPPGHPGNPAWRAVAPIAALGRHMLLLSATPLEDDAHGFFRLLQLLRPDEFPEGMSLDERLDRGVPLPPCTSATRRTDIGGLPPRIGIPIDLRNGVRPHYETELRQRGATAAVRKHAADRLRRALASGAALRPLLGPEETALRRDAEAMDATDPRIEWLVTQAPRWRAAGEKTLVFVAHRETLELLRTALSHRAQLATGAFHEDLSPVRRDTEVALFRSPDGPSLLISTEAGGEGRNFEFCRRLILFDLPWKPTVVEQRIGRLDRIGRRIPVEIVYFRPAQGIDADVARLFEQLGVFREPLAGLDPQLARIELAIEDHAFSTTGAMTEAQIRTIVTEAQASRNPLRAAAYQQLHRDPYHATLAAPILARVPAELDGLIESVVTRASERLGFRVEHLRGHRTFAIELGNESLVDSLPGVPGGAAFVGTFDREEAVEDEGIDFFASGHPLVEGILLHFEDAPIGRTGQLELIVPGEQGEGLAAFYKDGPSLEVVVFDAEGTERPKWVAAVRMGGSPAGPAKAGHYDNLRRAAARLDPARRPYALAWIIVRPE